MKVSIIYIQDGHETIDDSISRFAFCLECNREIFLCDLIINDMKRIYKKLFKSKKPSLGSILGPGSATLTSTLITNTTDVVPSIPASDTTASAHVTAGVSVSVQLRPPHL